MCYNPQFHLWKLRLREVLGVARDPTGVISGHGGIGATTAPRVSSFVSVPKSWPGILAHRHLAGLCLFEVNSLEAAWLSPYLAGKESARLPRPEVEKNPRGPLVPRAAASLGWGLPVASPLPPPSETPFG